MSDPERAPLTSQRIGRMARPMSLILLGLLLAAAVPPLRVFVVVLTVAGVVYLIGKQTMKERGDDL